MSKLNLSLAELQTLAQGLEIEYIGMNKEQLQNALTSNVTMYSKVGCPHCEKAKDLLNKKGVPYNTINVTPKTKQEMMERIHQKTGRIPSGTFPQIVNGSNLIGGNDELQIMFGKKKNLCIIS